MASGAIIARIVSQYTDKGAKAARKDIAKLGANFDQFAKRAVKSFAIAGAATAALAIKIGVDSVKAAINAQAEQNRLRQILETTNGATARQIQVLTDQADALERVGVVSAGTISVVQSQLATFDLQLDTIETLTPAILDYVTSEKGATAGAEQFKSMTNGLAQALNGQFGALTRVGFVLDEQTKKMIASGTESERANAIVKVLNSTYKGFNEALRDTPEGQLQATTNAIEALKTEFGGALLPVVMEFTNYVQSNVLPALEKWVSANKDKVAASLKNVFEIVKNLVVQMGVFFGFISRNIKTLQVFGAVLAGIFLGTKIYAGVTALIAVITLLTAAFSGQAAAASAAAVATGFATAGVSLVAGAAAAILFYSAMKKVTSGLDISTVATTFATQSRMAYVASLKKSSVIVAKMTKQEKIAATLAAANAKKAAKVAANLLLTEKELLALKKLGANVTSETDPIALRAAELNLMKQAMITQQAADFAALERLKVQLLSNAAVQRYVDLLGVVADQVISAEEVVILSLKWKISQEAVVAYISAIFAVNDGKLSTEEIDLLAKQWGVTKEQAEMYLDFFAAINDGKLDKTEVDALMTKWKLTSKEVSDYAKKISDGVTPSDLWPTPGNQAAKSWRDALAALNAYLKAVGGGTLAPTPNTPVVPTVPVAPTAPTPLVPGVIGKAVIESLTSAQAEEILQTMPSSVATTLTPSQISGNRYAAQGQAQMDAMLAKIDLGGVAQSSFQSGIASGNSVAASLSGSRYAAQAAAQAGMTTINVTVQGSVTSERDLTNTLRNALLMDQSNGSSITYTSAI